MTRILLKRGSGKENKKRFLIFFLTFAKLSFILLVTIYFKGCDRDKSIKEIHRELMFGESE
jgi:hypothetical protein